MSSAESNRLTSTTETRMRKADTAAVSVTDECIGAIGECAAKMSFQYVHRI